MEYVDLAVRGGAISLLLMLAIIMLGSRIGTEARISICAVAVSKSAFLLTSSAIVLPFPAILHGNLILFASLTPNALTWLIVTIFIDPPGRRWPWFVASSIVSAALYLHHVAPEIGSICALLAIPLYGALLAMSLWSARDDLVECRCRARPAFAVSIAGLSLFLTVIQAFSPLELGMPLLALMQGFATFAVAFAFAIWILRADMSLWPGPQEVAEPRSVSTKGDDAIDHALVSRITAAMDAGIWREEGLTIGALAQQLSMPEHRVRRAINQGLGYRNFSSFINAARIEAARALLSDPDHAGTTVLEIAYTVGFASLGPFNRAFRGETGLSPTEFRKEMEAQPDERENSMPIPANLH